MGNYDVGGVRRRFPALGRVQGGRPVVYLDGPGGSQVVDVAIRAMTAYMERGGANLHGPFASSVETEGIIASVRGSAADFLNALPGEIAFGPNMTTLNYGISRALSRTWGEGDEVVVTELDHRANVDPWLQAAKDAGAAVRWLPLDTDTLTLDYEALESVITARTKLVAVGLASNIVGTVTDVARVSARAREVGALVAVDAVHAAPHIPVDRDALGADVLTCSAYKFFGPHVGLAAIRREVFDDLDVYRLDPAPPHSPDKLETGTQNHEGIAGVGGALDFIESLGGDETRRGRFAGAMRSVAEYEDRLAARLRESLAQTPGVTLHQAPNEAPKTPTVAFTVRGRGSDEVAARLSREGYFTAAGHFYASTVAARLGLPEGVVRAGLAPYSTEDEVEGFVRALRNIV